MKLYILLRTLVWGTTVVVLSGCVSYPVSKGLREQAKPVTLTQVTSNPNAYVGTVVIWGGKVIKTVNSTNGADIYALKLPLHHEQPQLHASSTGRFIAHSQGFIDPEVFKKGRLITVAGDITGVRTETLQKIQYPYPVLAIRELHLWHIAKTYYYPGWYGPGWYGPGWGWGWGWGAGWYGPGWYGPDWDRDWD